MGALTIILLALTFLVCAPVILVSIGLWLFVGLAATTPRSRPRADHSILNETTKETSP
jgi:hypothetical protein